MCAAMQLPSSLAPNFSCTNPEMYVPFVDQFINHPAKLLIQTITLWFIKVGQPVYKPADQFVNLPTHL